MYVTPGRVAHMYYFDGLTQQQIANRLGISRIRVSRILQQARDDGTVRIRIAYNGYFPELESELAEAYPAITFVVCDGVDQEAPQLHAALGSAGAQLLNAELHDGNTVAVGWGRTLRAVAHELDGKKPNLAFIPLIGGALGAGLDVHANSVAADMAARTGGRAMALFAPALAETAEARNQLMESQAVRRPLSSAARADVCVFSVGDPFSGESTLEQVGYYSREDVEELARVKAVCDIVAISYYNKNSEPVAPEISARTVSITQDQLHAIPKRICIAGGSAKRVAISVTLRLGIVTHLVTDDQTARNLLHLRR